MSELRYPNESAEYRDARDLGARVLQTDPGE
jgi:hypothetical protein